MIYSVVPYDLIFEPQADLLPQNYISVKGGVLEVDDHMQIRRVISTDLHQYLQYSVGGKINSKKQ